MRYLYYHLWKLLSKIKTHDMPATNAMILISMVHFLNLSLIYIFINYLSLVKIHFASRIYIYISAISLGVVVYTINYFYLYRNKDRLFEKYKYEGKRSIIIGNILLIFYLVGSFVLFLYFLSKYT